MIDPVTVSQGIELLLRPENLIWLLVGFGAGIVVGAIPGFVESTFLAIVLPFTLYMDVWSAMFFMVGAYVAAELAGSIPAILINMPGTPGATATTFEGYELTKKNLGGQAMGASLLSSSSGIFLGALSFMLLGPLFGEFALGFGSPELLMLGVFGMTAVASLTGSSVRKGLISALLGLLIATTGLDLFEAVPRAHFGVLELYDALPILPALLGLFGLSELLTLAGRDRVVLGSAFRYQGMKAPLQGILEAVRLPIAMVRSAAIGIVVGVVPGAGATTASVVSYGQAKQWSRRPEKFGKGTFEGIVATDVANSSVVAGALVPTLTLGIPGSGTTVIMMAAMMMQGVRPGPDFFEAYSVEAFAIGWSMLFCAFLTIIVCLPLAGTFSRLAYLPLRRILPFICVACIVGVFSTRGYLVDITVFVVFGVLGYLVRQHGYSAVALLLGLILGPLLEQNFHRVLLVGGLELLIMRPVSLSLIFLSALTLIAPLVVRIRAGKKRSAA